MVFTTMRVSVEQVEYLESLKIIPQEPLDSVLQRIIDKAKAFDKKVKS
jgi:hypothetical protein